MCDCNVEWWGESGGGDGTSLKARDVFFNSCNACGYVGVRLTAVMVFTCRISATKVQSFEHVILILSFTVETVKVDAVVDMLISISLGRFLIVHCVNVLDGKRHPGHLHGRKGRNMVPSKAVSERCGLGALASFSAESECSGDAVTGRSLCVAVVH